MRFLIQVILTSLLSYVLQQFMAPWVVVPIALCVALVVQNNAIGAFFGGFAGISLLWMAKATVIDVYTQSILSAKVAAVLGFKSPIMLIFLTGLLGGLLGGLGGASGQHIRYILKKKPRGGYRI
jgi:hypothetical protein